VDIGQELFGVEAGILGHQEIREQAHMERSKESGVRSQEAGKGDKVSMGHDENCGKY
jgi:hypothetical protein